MAPLGDGDAEGDTGEQAADAEMPDADGEEAPAGEEGEQEDDEEGRAPVLRKGPVMPSKQEMEEHMATHIPYRDWCEHCVRGRGRNDPHRSGGDDRRQDPTPTVSMDYGFLLTKMASEEDESAESEQCGPMLVMKDHKEGNIFAMVVPAKGVPRPWVPKRATQWIEQLGHAKIILKSDGERAIVKLAKEIRKCRGEDSATLLEHPEPGESKSNGSTEGAVGIMEGMVRTVKDGLERRIGATLKPTDLIIPWLVEHASHLYSRYRVGTDGRTPMERTRGRRIKRPVCELGEQILYMPLKAGRGGKYDAKFHKGIYLGSMMRTGETIIGTNEGVVRARAPSGDLQPRTDGAQMPSVT